MTSPYFSVFRLRQLKTLTAYLYLLCFCVHRYRRHVDILTASLIHQQQQIDQRAVSLARENLIETRLDGQPHLKKAGQVLKLFVDETLDLQTPFIKVQRHAF